MGRVPVGPDQAAEVDGDRLRLGPIAIVPVALPPAKASSIAAGPCLMLRLTGTSVPFSTVVASVASPIGIFAVSVTTQVFPLP